MPSITNYKDLRDDESESNCSDFSIIGTYNGSVSSESAHPNSTSVSGSLVSAQDINELTDMDCMSDDSNRASCNSSLLSDVKMPSQFQNEMSYADDLNSSNSNCSHSQTTDNMLNLQKLSEDLKAANIKNRKLISQRAHTEERLKYLFYYIQYQLIISRSRNTKQSIEDQLEAEITTIKSDMMKSKEENSINATATHFSAEDRMQRDLEDEFQDELEEELQYEFQDDFNDEIKKIFQVEDLTADLQRLFYASCQSNKENNICVPQPPYNQSESLEHDLQKSKERSTEVVICKLCSRNCLTLDGYYEHIKTHFMLQCGFCETTFVNENYLNHHLIETHLTTSFDYNVDGSLSDLSSLDSSCDSSTLPDNSLKNPFISGLPPKIVNLKPETGFCECGREIKMLVKTTSFPKRTSTESPLMFKMTPNKKKKSSTDTRVKKITNEFKSFDVSPAPIKISPLCSNNEETGIGFVHTTSLSASTPTFFAHSTGDEEMMKKPESTIVLSAEKAESSSILKVKEVTTKKFEPATVPSALKPSRFPHWVSEEEIMKGPERTIVPSAEKAGSSSGLKLKEGKKKKSGRTSVMSAPRRRCATHWPPETELMKELEYPIIRPMQKLDSSISLRLRKQIMKQYESTHAPPASENDLRSLTNEDIIMRMVTYSSVPSAEKTGSSSGLKPKEAKTQKSERTSDSHAPLSRCTVRWAAEEISRKRAERNIFPFEPRSRCLAHLASEKKTIKKSEPTIASCEPTAGSSSSSKIQKWPMDYSQPSTFSFMMKSTPEHQIYVCSCFMGFPSRGLLIDHQINCPVVKKFGQT